MGSSSNTDTEALSDLDRPRLLNESDLSVVLDCLRLFLDCWDACANMGSLHPSEFGSTVDVECVDEPAMQLSIFLELY